MSRSARGFDRAMRDIDQKADAAAYERARADEAEALADEHEREDREFAARRIRAIGDAHPDGRALDRVIDKFACLEAEVLRDRARHRRTSQS